MVPQQCCHGRTNGHREAHEQQHKATDHTQQQPFAGGIGRHGQAGIARQQQQQAHHLLPAPALLARAQGTVQAGAGVG